ncbi:unnamed protein product [Camellia sinensis]
MWRPWFGQFGRLVMTSSLMEFKSDGNLCFRIALWVKYKCKDVVFAVNGLVFNLAAVRGFRVQLVFGLFSLFVCFFFFFLTIALACLFFSTYCSNLACFVHACICCCLLTLLLTMGLTKCSNETGQCSCV